MNGNSNVLRALAALGLLSGLGGCPAAPAAPDAGSPDAAPALPADAAHGPGEDAGRPGGADAAASLDASLTADAGVPGDELVAALCQVLEKCEAQLGPGFADSAACERHFSKRLSCGTSGQRNEPARDRCLGWLKQVTCTDPVLSFGCVAVADPLHCSDPLAQFARLGAPGCGQVFAAPYAAQGEQCAALPCDEGLYCKRGVTSGTCRVCAALAAPGAACRD